MKLFVMMIGNPIVFPMSIFPAPSDCSRVADSSIWPPRPHTTALMASTKDSFLTKIPMMPLRLSCSCGHGILRTLAVLCTTLPLRSALELEAIQGSSCLRVVLKVGDSIKADPRCVVSRGMGLVIESPAEAKASFVRQFRRRLLFSVGERHDPLHTLSNKMASNATDCVIAPSFPGDLAIVSIQDSDGKELDAHRTQGKGYRKNTGDKRASNPRRDARGRDDDEAETINRGNTRDLIVMSQALVAVGPDVSVTPMGERSKQFEAITRRARAGSPRPGAASMSRCSGNGPVAIAGCGRLMRVRLRPGQKRAVDWSRAVGWTETVKWAPGGEARWEKGDRAAVVHFEGPGIVFIQTQSIGTLRRLLGPEIGIGTQRWAGKAVPSRGRSVGLSLKRGIVKRARAGVRRVIQASAFFVLYLMIYSVVTALLLDGWEGLAKAPRHALQVVASLARVVKIAAVLVRVGLEELRSKERLIRRGDGGENTPALE